MIIYGRFGLSPERIEKPVAMWTHEEVLRAPDLIIELRWEPKITSAAVPTARLDNGWIPACTRKDVVGSQQKT